MTQPKQADYDLERAIALFDDALTSKDERVINALRSLLMIVTLTAPESNETAEMGPLRSMQADLYELNKRVRKLETMTWNNVRDRDREELDALKSQSWYAPAGLNRPSVASNNPKDPNIYDTNLIKKLGGLK